MKCIVNYMRKLRKSSVLMIAITIRLTAATYFVSPEGSDSNHGSMSKPFRTVAKGVSVAGPGDTILLGNGVYGAEGHISDGTGGWHGYATPVAISKAGKPTAWITLRAEQKGEAVLDCGTTASNLGCDVYLYLKRTAAYWSFEDLTVIRGAYAGINTNEGASHIRIKGCKFENIGNRRDTGETGIAGVGFGPAEATDWTIEGNVFHHIGRTGGHYPSLDHGIYADGSDAVIRNNLFYRMDAGWGIQTSHGARNWIIENNTFAFPNPMAAGQIMLWDGGTPNSVSGIEIRDNIFYGPRKSAIVIDGKIASCTVENNVTTADLLIDDPTQCSIRNNLTGADPRFVNSANQPYDFRLSPESPANGRGWSPVIPAVLAN